jgi:hypothetical protein
MGKNFLGYEDNSFPEDSIVTYGTVPSIESAIQQLTGVRVPLIDLTRGGGATANNAAVLASQLARYMPRESMMPEATPALNASGAEASGDRIRQIRDRYLAKQEPAPVGVRPIYPSME